MRLRLACVLLLCAPAWISDPVHAQSDCPGLGGTGSHSAEPAQGVLGAFAVMTSAGLTSSSAYVSDEFIVSGPPPGAPISITALLNVIASTNASGSINPYSFVAGSLRDLDSGQADSVGQEGGGTLSYSKSLHLDLSAISGQPVHLEYSVYSTAGLLCCPFSGGITTIGQGILGFVLPTGTKITSCFGYSAPDPVAAREVSWGNVRARYR